VPNAPPVTTAFLTRPRPTEEPTPTATPRPTQAPQSSDSLDDLINGIQQPGDGGSANRTTDRDLGDPSATQPLPGSTANAVGRHFGNCWRPNIGLANFGSLEVAVIVRIDRNNNVDDANFRIEPLGGGSLSDPTYSNFATTAALAARRCDNVPIPPGQQGERSLRLIYRGNSVVGVQ